MADLEQARSLLRMAYKDFNALIGMQGSALFAEEIFGFHVQQSVEKALKAWLCASGDPYPLTHDLTRLFTLLQDQNAEIGKFWPLAQYTLFAVQARYEESVADLDEPIDRTLEIEHVRELLAHVAQRLAPE